MDLHVAVGTDAVAKDAVDATLRLDPIGAYSRMDALSRADYHTQTKMWAQRAGRTAAEVAQAAIDLAMQAQLRTVHPTAVRTWAIFCRTTVFATLQPYWVRD